MYDITDIPVPSNERELTWLLSFYWNADQAYETVAQLNSHKGEGNTPDATVVQKLQEMYQKSGLNLSGEASTALIALEITS